MQTPYRSALDPRGPLALNADVLVMTTRDESAELRARLAEALAHNARLQAGLATAEAAGMVAEAKARRQYAPVFHLVCALGLQGEKDVATIVQLAVEKIEAMKDAATVDAVEKSRGVDPPLRPSAWFLRVGDDDLRSIHDMADLIELADNGMIDRSAPVHITPEWYGEPRYAAIYAVSDESDGVELFRSEEKCRVFLESRGIKGDAE